MKYQIVLESDSLFTDQEVNEIVGRWFSKRSTELDGGAIIKFNLLYAQSLEGIRREVFEIKEDLKNKLIMNQNFNKVIDTVEDSFDSLNLIFNK
jgi:hypothetical protein